ncbi:MAG TPA: hypothetical protein ENN80_05965, partial [Candidatus Hydrogenedentes bacterium]|nr:hypothetical protein [Candidatus Hydrogenedentota bacterium]
MCSGRGRRVRKIFVGGALVGALMVCAGATAQFQSDLEVGAIELRGLERVSEQLVRSQLETQTGKPYNPRGVARDIRRLYALGFFDHVSVEGEQQGAQLVVTFVVTEKQRIAELRIVGAKRKRARDIRSALSWKEGDAFVPVAHDDERDAILTYYEEKGFPNAQVNIVVDDAGAGRVRVTYFVDEGKKARIRRIDIEGNEALSDRKVKKAIKTRRAWWFIGGRYDEEKFEADLERILDAYGNIGRLDAEIAKTSMHYANEGKRLDIAIGVQEGLEYTVETLLPAGNKVYDTDEILDIIEVHAGDVHNKGQIRTDAEVIEKGYHDSGYVNARVVAQTTLDRDRKTTHVVHHIEEDSLKYVREIKITGNTVTKDEVIRRQLLI